MIGIKTKVTIIALLILLLFCIPVYASEVTYTHSKVLQSKEGRVLNGFLQDSGYSGAENFIALTLNGYQMVLHQKTFVGKGVTSSDKKIISVDSKGFVTAKKAGTAIISFNGMNCVVTVVVPKLSQTKTINLSQEQIGSVTLLNYAGKVDWVSSDTSVVQVFNGNIFCGRPGRATITAIAGGRKYNVNVTVRPNSLATSLLNVPLGKSSLLSRDKSVSWNVIGSAYVKNNRVYPTINARSAVISTKLQVVQVYGINNGYTEVPTRNIILKIGERKLLMYPNHGFPKWSSTNPSIVSVSEYGVAIGIMPGTATLKAKVGSQQVSIKVTVSPEVSAVQPDTNFYRPQYLVDPINGHAGIILYIEPNGHYYFGAVTSYTSSTNVLSTANANGSNGGHSGGSSGGNGNGCSSGDSGDKDDDDGGGGGNGGDSNKNSTKFTVTFDSQNGDPVSTQTVAKGNKVVKPANPIMVGYNIAGWFTNKECTRRWNFDNTVTSDMTLYAGWEIINYTLTYDLDGGSTNGENPPTYTVATNSFTLINPTKINKTFLGWVENEGDTPKKNVTITKGTYGNRSFKAMWVDAIYTVTFNLNGGQGQSSVQVPKGECIIGVNDPTRTGYEFTGWFKDESLTESWNMGSDVVNSDMTLYAGWYDLNSTTGHTVSFYNGTTLVTTVHVEDGKVVGVPTTVPEKEHYTFSNWTLNASPYNFSTPVTKDINLYAAFTPVQYTIAVNLNGGTVAGNSTYGPLTYTVEDRSGIVFTAASKEGYNFLGWSWFGHNTPTLSVDANEFIGNVTVNANYQLITKTVSLDLNGGNVNGNTTYGPVEYSIINPPSSVIPTPVRPGYNFDGWEIDGQLTPIKSNDITPEMLVNDDLIKAIWTLNEYTISTVLNGGNVSGSTTHGPFTCSIESPPSSKLSDPTKSGYEFLGWTWDTHSSPIKSANISYSVLNTSKTISASWKLITHILTIDLAGGNIGGNTSFGPLTVSIETSLPSVLPNPVKDSFVFRGWTWDGQLTPVQTADIDVTTINSDRTLVANWSSTSYQMSFDLAGGTIGGNTTYGPLEFTSTDHSTIVLQDPVKQHYTFTGWTWSGHTTPTKSSSVNVNSFNDNVTLIANYTPVVYTITFDLDGGEISDSTTYGPIEYTVEDKSSIVLVDPTKEHYDYKGWTWEGNTTKTISSSVDKSTLAGNYTFKANYTLQQYVITIVPHDTTGYTSYSTNEYLYYTIANRSALDNYEYFNSPLENEEYQEVAYKYVLGYMWEGQDTLADTIDFDQFQYGNHTVNEYFVPAEECYVRVPTSAEQWDLPDTNNWIGGTISYNSVKAKIADGYYVTLPSHSFTIGSTTRAYSIPRTSKVFLTYNGSSKEIYSSVNSGYNGISDGVDIALPYGVGKVFSFNLTFDVHERIEISLYDDKDESNITTAFISNEYYGNGIYDARDYITTDNFHVEDGTNYPTLHIDSSFEVFNDEYGEYNHIDYLSKYLKISAEPVSIPIKPSESVVIRPGRINTLCTDDIYYSINMFLNGNLWKYGSELNLVMPNSDVSIDLETKCYSQERVGMSEWYIETDQVSLITVPNGKNYSSLTIPSELFCEEPYSTVRNDFGYGSYDYYHYTAIGPDQSYFGPTTMSLVEGEIVPLRTNDYYDKIEVYKGTDVSTGTLIQEFADGNQPYDIHFNMPSTDVTITASPFEFEHDSWGTQYGLRVFITSNNVDNVFQGY